MYKTIFPDISTIDVNKLFANNYALSKPLNEINCSKSREFENLKVL